MPFSVIRSVLSTLSIAIQAFCMAVLFISLSITVAQVVARTFFETGFPWAEEATRYLLVWLVLLGASVVVRINDHLGIKLLQDVLPKRPRAAVQILLNSAVLLVAVLVAVYGYGFATGASFITSAGLSISMTWAYAALPVAAVPMALFALFNIVVEIGVLVTGNRLQDDTIDRDRAALVQLARDED